MQHRDAAKETTDEGRRRALRRFDDAVVALTKAFNLASATYLGRSVREEVGFFQTIRAALAKSVPDRGGMSSAKRDLAVQQIVSRSVISTEIVDILKAAGITAPDISILSDEFLAGAQTMDRPNLALEALRKLIAGGGQIEEPHECRRDAGLLGASGRSHRPLSLERDHHR